MEFRDDLGTEKHGVFLFLEDTAMEENTRGIYCINICDPDTREVIIESVDRVYGTSISNAVKVFKKFHNWQSNWFVQAIPKF